jgi:hypothetical protein
LSCEFTRPKYRLLENNNNKFFFCKSQKNIVFLKESFFGFVSSPKRSPFFFWSCEFTRSINGLLENNNNNNNNKILFFASPKSSFCFFKNFFQSCELRDQKMDSLNGTKIRKRVLGEKINPSKILKWNHNRNWIILEKSIQF